MWAVPPSTTGRSSTPGGEATSSDWLASLLQGPGGDLHPGHPRAGGQPHTLHRRLYIQVGRELTSAVQRPLQGGLPRPGLRRRLHYRDVAPGLPLPPPQPPWPLPGRPPAPLLRRPPRVPGQVRQAAALGRCQGLAGRGGGGPGEGAGGGGGIFSDLYRKSCGDIENVTFFPL